MLQSTLSEIAKEQKLEAFKTEELIEELDVDLPNITTHALILSGIRRCSKHTFTPIRASKF